jgi:N-acetylneuraminate lyase
MTPRQFWGAWPALLTPADADGGVDVDKLEKLTARLVDKGVDGLYLCGSTGEGVFLSVPERQRVADVVAVQVAAQIPIIVHVGAVATRDAVALARHAQQLGVDGIASILPPFGQSLAETLVHYEAVAAAAPDLGFYPYLFGGETDALTLIQTLLERVSNLAGAKYTGPDMYELHALVNAGTRRYTSPDHRSAGTSDQSTDEGWTIFSGMDQQCLFAAMFGATANIGSTLNLMPGAYREIRTRYEAGDLIGARDLQLRVNRVTRVLQQFGFFGALFEALRYLGLDCGAPRLPHLPLPQDRRSPLHQALVAADLPTLAAL